MFSFIALAVLSPLLIIVYIWLAIANKGAGVFFLQDRPGRDEKIFKIIKFKTMTDERDENGQLLPDMKRLTKIGKFIRNTSFDELPQLVNVLIGNMSLIGPRPLLPKYLPLYNEEQKRRHSVRPGITGWAQVNGRNSISWADRFKLDIYYIDNISFTLDVKIIYYTLCGVFSKKDINQNNDDTMEAFNGHN